MPELRITLMNKQQDAALGSSEFCPNTIHQHVTGTYLDCIANVVRYGLCPGTMNIITNQVIIFMEFQSEGTRRAEELETTLKESGNFSLELDFEHLRSVTEWFHTLSGRLNRL